MLHQVLEQLRKPPEQVSPSKLIWLTQQLGDLAYWWLRPEALQKLPVEFRQAQPDCRPRESGGCAILFAQNDSNSFPALRPAFLLPLRWCACGDEATAPKLPKTVVQLAQQVGATLLRSNSPNSQLARWPVSLSARQPPRVSLPDLAEELKLSPESGWGWLATGLILVSSGWSDARDAALLPRPDPSVWVTANWSDEQRVRSLGLLGANVRLAMESGARLLFVPASQVPEAKAYLGPPCRLRIKGLSENTTEPRRA